MGKSELAKKYASCGKWKEALGLAKDFRIGITKAQHSIMVRAYECIVWPEFYKSIGKDIQTCINEGKSVFNEVMQ